MLFLNYFIIRTTSCSCNFGMQISFGSPPALVDDIHIQSYLDSFDWKQKISIIRCAKLVNSKYLFSTAKIGFMMIFQKVKQVENWNQIKDFLSAIFDLKETCRKTRWFVLHASFPTDYRWFKINQFTLKMTYLLIFFMSNFFHN